LLAWHWFVGTSHDHVQEEEGLRKHSRRDPHAAAAAEGGGRGSQAGRARGSGEPAGRRGSPVGDPDTWTFDAVFNNAFTQKDIFMQEVQPLCDAVLQGYNATVFAYGQSGSGKTFTMTGDLQGHDPAKHGMMPQAVEYLFDEIKKLTSSTKAFKVKISYVELYRTKARDLLSSKKENLDVKENMAKSFFVKGALITEVASWERSDGPVQRGHEPPLHGRHGAQRAQQPQSLPIHDVHRVF
jgi:hypothetical protein